MKKNCSIVLILFASLMYTLSYATDDSNSGEMVFMLNEVDIPPRVIKMVQPIYPSRMTLKGELYSEGHVMVGFIVTKDGGVRDPEVVSAEPKGVYESSAIEAIKKFKFKPAIKNGGPVECYVRQPMKFEIPSAEGPLHPYTVAENGFNFINVGEYYKAIESFNEAIRRGYSPAYSGRGTAYMKLKEYKKAIKDFNTAIRVSGSIEHIFLLESQVFGPLSEDYKKTVKRKFAFNYKLRGEAYSAMKKYKKAIMDYNRAIKLDPEMLEAYFERGEAFRNLNKYRKAIADYTKVIELDKGYMQAYNNRAAAYNKQNDPEKMCLDLKKACDLSDCRGLELAKNEGNCRDDVINGAINN